MVSVMYIRKNTTYRDVHQHIANMDKGAVLRFVLLEHISVEFMNFLITLDNSD